MAGIKRSFAEIHTDVIETKSKRAKLSFHVAAEKFMNHFSENDCFEEYLKFLEDPTKKSTTIYYSAKNNGHIPDVVDNNDMSTFLDTYTEGKTNNLNSCGKYLVDQFREIGLSFSLVSNRSSGLADPGWSYEGFHFCKLKNFKTPSYHKGDAQAKGADKSKGDEQ